MFFCKNSKKAIKESIQRKYIIFAIEMTKHGFYDNYAWKD